MDKKVIDTYNDIMNDIVSRTGGEWDRMSYSDKVMCVSIMKDIKIEMDKYLREQYPIVKMWAALDIDDIRLSCTEPDFSSFEDNIKTLDKFNSVHNL